MVKGEEYLPYPQNFCLSIFLVSENFHLKIKNLGLRIFFLEKFRNKTKILSKCKSKFKHVLPNRGLKTGKGTQTKKCRTAALLVHFLPREGLNGTWLHLKIHFFSAAVESLVFKFRKPYFKSGNSSKTACIVAKRQIHAKFSYVSA